MSGMLLENPIGKVAEVDLTNLYIETFQMIFETFSNEELSPERRKQEILKILSDFRELVEIIDIGWE